MGWNRWMRWIRRRSDADFAAEIESHLALEVDRLIQAGMSPTDARFEARRAFGNPTSAHEHFRDARPGSTLESFAQDVRYGLRAMRRSPGFTAIAVTSLAIGIGANTTMFSSIDRLLVRSPQHVRDAERIHRVYIANRSEGEDTGPLVRQSYRTYSALRDHVPAFESVAAFSARSVSSGRGTDARPLEAVLATPSFFTLLGVSPVLGRFFAPNEELDEGEHVAVLGYGAWQTLFGGDRAILGRPIDVAGVPHIIVGVAPNGFTGVDLDRVDLWLPLGVGTRLVGRGAVNPRAGGYWLEIVAKRRMTVPETEAASQATQAYRDAWRDDRRYAERYAKNSAMLGPVVAARGPAASADAKVSVWVAAVSLLVLLIACANVANLLLLRGLTRAREVALRLSLGASRWRVTRQWLVEGALLAAAGAVSAIVLARWSASALRAFLLPRVVNEPVLDGRLLAFTAVIALGTAMLATVIPALVVARRDFGPLLGAGRVVGSQSRLLLQRTLIGVQVALATLLLIGAGLFVTSLRNVRSIDLGVDVDHLLYVKVDLTSSGKASDNRASGASATANANAVYMAMLERLRRVPGVVNATVTAGEPLTSGWGISLVRRGAPPPAEGTPVPFGRAVGTDYFATMGTSLRRGRRFTAADHVPGAHVAIVDEATAKHFWPNADPLDPCVYLDSGNVCTQIVGVVATTVLWEITGDKGQIVYVPLESWPDREVTTLEVRTAGDPSAMVDVVRQAVSSVSPELPWADIRPVAQHLAPQLRSWRLGASMFTAFGILALCLAAVGLYGLVSYMVARRSHEIGVRKALGASHGGIVRLVLRGGLAMTVIGLVIGIVAALGAGELIAGQLYGVSPRDPVVIALCIGTLIAVAVVACVGPARRAARVDPMVTLRSE